MTVEQLPLEIAQPIIRVFTKGLITRGTDDPIDPDFLSASWYQLMRAGHAFTYSLTDEDERRAPRGILLGSIVPDLFTGRLQGLEFLWQVQPGYNGLPLLKRFEADCKAAGCKQIIVGLNHRTSDVERLEKLYLRRGYRPYSNSYRKVI